MLPGIMCRHMIPQVFKYRGRACEVCPRSGTPGYSSGVTATKRIRRRRGKRCNQNSLNCKTTARMEHLYKGMRYLSAVCRWDTGGFTGTESQYCRRWVLVTVKRWLLKCILQNKAGYLVGVYTNGNVKIKVVYRLEPGSIAFISYSYPG